MIKKSFWWFKLIHNSFSRHTNLYLCLCKSNNRQAGDRGEVSQEGLIGSCLVTREEEVAGLVGSTVQLHRTCVKGVIDMKLEHAQPRPGLYFLSHLTQSALRRDRDSCVALLRISTDRSSWEHWSLLVLARSHRPWKQGPLMVYFFLCLGT